MGPGTPNPPAGAEWYGFRFGSAGEANEMLGLIQRKGDHWVVALYRRRGRNGSKTHLWRRVEGTFDETVAAVSAMREWRALLAGVSSSRSSRPAPRDRRASDRPEQSACIFALRRAAGLGSAIKPVKQPPGEA